MTTKKMTTFYLDVSVCEVLRERAQELNVSMSALLEHLVRGHAADPTLEAWARAVPASRGSLAGAPNKKERMVLQALQATLDRKRAGCATAVDVAQVIGESRIAVEKSLKQLALAGHVASRGEIKNEDASVGAPARLSLWGFP